ncbi:MAG: AAA family ATPase [Alphaproteobacteria bacterium]|nr:AAA family ATPase [Alphaproteobacteria bacterium]
MAANQEVFSAFIESSDDIEVLNNVAKQLGLKNYEIKAGGISQAIDLYREKKSPAFLIVDISKSELPISDMAQLLEVCSPNINIIAVGQKNEVSLYRDLNKIGIYEYLLTPLFSEILERTLQSMLSGKAQVEGKSTKSGKIIACMGSRGGVGATFIASNLAAMLSMEKLRRVVLIDLDLYFGTLSLNFDLKPSFGLREVFESPGRIDQVFIDRLLVPVNQRLFLLSSEEPLQEKIQYKIEGLEELLTYLSKQFHYVIVDIPHYFNEFISTMLLKANIMLLITEPSVANLRDAGRLTHYLNLEGGVDRSIIVMNKSGQYKKSELGLEEFEKNLKNKINHTILYNNLLPLEFLNQGKTMENTNNPLAESIREIMLDILGTRKAEKKEGWFKKLF